MRFSLFRVICHTCLVSTFIGLGTIHSEAVLAQQISPLVTNPVDDAARATLTGNVRPLARPQFDKGEAPDDMAMNRLLLVLRRSYGQFLAVKYGIIPA